MPVSSTQPAPQDQFSDIEKQLKSSQQELDIKLAPIQAEKSQAEQGLMGELSKPIPEVPQTQPIQQFQPRQISQQEASNFAGIATAFAALASLKTREPFTAALNAAGDAMKGFQKGNLDQAKIDIENFNTKTRAAIEENQRLMDQYNAVLNNRKLSITQKQSMLGVIAAKEQDEIALETLKTGQAMNFYKLADSRQRAQEALRMHKDQMAQTLEIARQRMDIQKQNLALREKMWGGAGGSGPGGLSQLGIDYLSAYMQLNGRMPIGMSRNNPAAWAVMNNLAETAQAAGLSPEEWAAAGPITHQKLASYGKIYQMRNAVGAWGDMLELNGGILKQLSNKVDRSGSAYANKSILWLKQHAITDPDVSEYLAQVEIFIPEVARALNNPNLTGVMTDTQKEEMRIAISGALPPQALNRVIDRFIADKNNREKTLDQRLNQIATEIRHPTGALSPREDPSVDQGLVYKGYRFPNKQALDKYKASEGATP